jgi:hypothetical protein
MSDQDSEQEQSDPGSSSEELDSSEPEEDTDRSFGQQFADLLNTEVPSKKCPILCFSKIPHKLQVLKEQDNKKEKMAVHMAQTKRKLLNSVHKDIAAFDERREAQIKKQATRGVIALFNANTQAKKPGTSERLTEPAEEKEEAKEGFLDLIMKAAVKSGK